MYFASSDHSFLLMERLVDVSDKIDWIAVNDQNTNYAFWASTCSKAKFEGRRI